MALKNVRLVFSEDVNNPTIINSNREINALLALIKDENVTLELGGYIFKESLYRAQYKALTEFVGLSGARQVQYNTLIDDVFDIYPQKNTLAEGESTRIIASGTIPVTAINYKIQHNVSITYAPQGATETQLKQIIEGRIKIENGMLSCAEAEENASWTDSLTITATPSGYEEGSAMSKTFNVTISAIAITDLVIRGLDDFDAGASYPLTFGLVPSGHTKSVNTNNMVWSTNGGSISQGGVLTAPTTQGRYQVTATLTMYPSGAYRDTISHSEAFVVTGALFSQDQNPIVFEAMKAAYPQFADRQAISTKDVKEITDIAPLFDELRALENGFSFDEFEYFDGIASLPTNRCMGGSKITSIRFPKNLNTISGLNNVNPNDVNGAIGAFANCLLLTSIYFGGVKNISGGTAPNNNYGGCAIGAFAGCISLTDIDFAEVESITGGYDDTSNIVGYNKLHGAFSGCTSLRSVDLKNVKILGHGSGGRYSFGTRGCFGDCTSLIEMNMPKLEAITNPQYNGESDCWSGIIKNCPISEIHFPNTLRTIEAGALRFSINISMFDFSNTQVTSFPCMSASINANNKNDSLFADCTNLTKVIFPHKAISFSTRADGADWNTWLRNCNSFSVADISGSSIDNIPSFLFALRPNSLRHIYIPSDNVIPLGSNALIYGTNKINYVFVKDSLVDAFKAASGWSNYVTDGGQILPVSTMASYGWTA